MLVVWRLLRCPLLLVRGVVTDFEAVADLVPDNGTPYIEIRAVEYLDSDGKAHFSVSHRGDVPLSSFIGLLELAKQEVLKEAAEW